MGHVLHKLFHPSWREEADRVVCRDVCSVQTAELIILPHCFIAQRVKALIPIRLSPTLRSVATGTHIGYGILLVRSSGSCSNWPDSRTMSDGGSGPWDRLCDSHCDFSPSTDWVVGGTRGTIQQRSSSSLFCGRLSWAVLAWTGRSTLWRLPIQHLLCRPRRRPPS